MAEEEFQESDVVFDDRDIAADQPVVSSPTTCGESINETTGATQTISVPVNIPMSAKRNAWLRCTDDSSDDGEIVPPHVIIGRRVAEKMITLSICGRIMKRRDLSEFRDSILRMTGFLEA